MKNLFQTKFALGALVAGLALFALSSSSGFANWMPPQDPPPFCTATQPGCFLPINATDVSQIKGGSLGIGGLGLLTADKLYSSAAGIGPGFVGGGQAIDPNATLDLDGPIRITGNLGGGSITSGAPLILAQNGDAGWGTGSVLELWEQRTTIPDDIQNIGAGRVGIATGAVNLPATLTVNGSVARAGAYLSDPSQINLGSPLGAVLSQTGGANSTIGGGQGNRALVDKATIRGGQSNYISQTAAAGSEGGTILGGRSNTINTTAPNLNYNEVIGGGQNNQAGFTSVVGGGQNNQAGLNSSQTSIFGGKNNVAAGPYVTILGGESNYSGGSYATVLGGQNNGLVPSFGVATVASGNTNRPSGSYSFVGGSGMHVSSIGGNGQGIFMWGNSSSVISSLAGLNNAFIVHPQPLPSPLSTEGRLIIGRSSTIGSAAPDLRLDVNGSVRIRSGANATGPVSAPTIGSVAAALDDVGNVKWESSSATQPLGESVMYLKTRSVDVDPPTCPTGWCDASAGIPGCTNLPPQAPLQEFSGSNGTVNKVRVCYHPTGRFRVINLKSTTAGAPPQCPASFSALSFGSNIWGTSYETGAEVRTRVCLSS